jgi:hypothetical protein
MRAFVDPQMPEYDGEEPPRPADPEVLRLAEAKVALDKALADLNEQNARDTGYHGQYSAEYFLRYEQEAYNRAAEAFADAVVAVVAKARGEI